MKILDEKEQIRIKLKVLDKLLKEQRDRQWRVERKLLKKRDWTLSFLIGGTESGLLWEVELEKGIAQAVEDYRNELTERLNK